MLRLGCDQKPANRILLITTTVCMCMFECRDSTTFINRVITSLHPFVSGKFCSPWMNSDQDELYHQYYSQYHHCQTRSWRHLCVTIVLEVDRLSIKVIFGVLTISHHKCLICTTSIYIWVNSWYFNNIWILYSYSSQIKCKPLML